MTHEAKATLGRAQELLLGHILAPENAVGCAEDTTLFSSYVSRLARRWPPFKQRPAEQPEGGDVRRTHHRRRPP